MKKVRRWPPSYAGRSTSGRKCWSTPIKARAGPWASMPLILWLLQMPSGPSGMAKLALDVFIEGFPPPPTLIIVGAGHIAIPLTTFAKTLNYRVVVVDARSAFATRERFPHADELIIAWPDEVLEKIGLNPSTSLAVLTHDPKFDEPTLKVALAHRVGYIGAVGSRKTKEERDERLKRQGITEEQIKRIHGPIGLNIGATSPEEMALAIMAEIVATRHGRDRATVTDWSKK